MLSPTGVPDVVVGRTSAHETVTGFAVEVRLTVAPASTVVVGVLLIEIVTWLTRLLTILSVALRAVTTMSAVAWALSTVAVTLVEPWFTPVRRPLAEIVAMLGLAEIHEIVFPDTVLPELSRAIAESCIVPPAETLAEEGVMDRLATTGETVTMAVPRTAPDEAVMIVVPAPTPVTRPEVDTLAILGDSDFHVTDFGVIGLPV
jgi:hypothetical protein